MALPLSVSAIWIDCTSSSPFARFLDRSPEDRLIDILSDRNRDLTSDKDRAGAAPAEQVEYDIPRLRPAGLAYGEADQGFRARMSHGDASTMFSHSQGSHFALDSMIRHSRLRRSQKSTLFWEFVATAENLWLKTF